MHARLRVAFGPIGHAQIGAPQHLGAFGTPGRFDLGADRRDAAARFAAHDHPLDAQLAGLAAKHFRSLFGQMQNEVRCADDTARARVRTSAQQPFRAAISPHRHVDRTHVLQSLHHRDAADKALGQRKRMQHHVAGPHAVGKETARRHLVPHLGVGFGQGHICGAAGCPRRGLHLDDVGHRRGAVLAEGRLCREAFANLGLVCVGQLLQVFDGADIAEFHTGLGELLLIEGRVRLEIGHLIAQPLFLNAAHLLERRALDWVPEVIVYLVGGILPPEAHSILHIILHSRPGDQ